MEAKLSAKDVYTRLRERILNFEIYPGSRVTETELAEYFGVSRTPIRSALQRLEAEGYLTVLPKQDCFISNLDIDDLSKYYQVRKTLEQLSLQLANTYMNKRTAPPLPAKSGKCPTANLVLSSPVSPHRWESASLIWLTGRW